MKYPALRFISKVYKVFAYIMLFLSVVISFIPSIGEIDTALTIGLAWNDLLGFYDFMLFTTILFGGSFVALINLAISEVLSVVMDIETNTRK